MNKILPYYSLLSIVFLMGCLQAFFVGIPKTLKHHPVVKQLLEKPEESALLLMKNGQVMIARNAKVQLPLASLSKIVIGIVFAEKTVEEVVDPEKKVSLPSLERFYVDDENYQTWKTIGIKEGWIHDDQVSLKYIAQGAIRFSANTNADFLMDFLGLETINNWLLAQGLSTHEAIFPFNASAMLCHNWEGLPKQRFLSMMDTLSTDIYTQQVLFIHERLADNDSIIAHALAEQTISDRAFLRIWSDRFTKATAEDYAKITRLLLNKKAMNKSLEKQITFLFEDWAFAENPSLDQQFSSIGYKGGSTGFLLNTILYLEDKAGNQAQVVLFLNGLSPKKYKLISKLFSGFVFDLATNDDFARNVQQVLKIPQ